MVIFLTFCAFFTSCASTPPDPPPIPAWYIGHTRGLQPLLSPSNILSHRKVPFQKMPPPHGKILKKGPAPQGCCKQSSLGGRGKENLPDIYLVNNFTGGWGWFNIKSFPDIIMLIDSMVNSYHY
jgi:hypothetical protein